MATQIYKTHIVYTVDGWEVEIAPLKVKYLRKAMEVFARIHTAQDDYESMEIFSLCAFNAMKQFLPQLQTLENFEDMFDIDTIYEILEHSVGIKIKQDPNEQKEVEDPSITEQAKQSGMTWDELDLVRLESELFLLGIWKDFDDLEKSLSMPEISALLEAKRDADYEEKKFSAAIQGVDLEAQQAEPDAWEKLKTKVFSGGRTDDPNDIIAYQGTNAAKAGFGIGMGLEYEKM